MEFPYRYLLFLDNSPDHYGDTMFIDDHVRNSYGVSPYTGGISVFQVMSFGDVGSGHGTVNVSYGAYHLSLRILVTMTGTMRAV